MGAPVRGGGTGLALGGGVGILLRFVQPCGSGLAHVDSLAGGLTFGTGMPIGSATGVCRFSFNRVFLELVVLRRTELWSPSSQ